VCGKIGISAYRTLRVHAKKYVGIEQGQDGGCPCGNLRVASVAKASDLIVDLRIIEVKKEAETGAVTCVCSCPRCSSIVEMDEKQLRIKRKFKKRGCPVCALFWYALDGKPTTMKEVCDILGVCKDSLSNHIDEHLRTLKSDNKEERGLIELRPVVDSMTYDIAGEKMTPKEIFEVFGVSYNAFTQRLLCGFSPETAVSEPTGRKACEARRARGESKHARKRSNHKEKQNGKAKRRRRKNGASD
jgi:hypothetical protein